MVQVVVTGFCSENEISIYNGKFKNINNASDKVNELIKKKKIDYCFVRIIGRKKIIKLDNFFVEKENDENGLQEEDSKGETTKADKKTKRTPKGETNPLRRFFDEVES